MTAILLATLVVTSAQSTQSVIQFTRQDVAMLRAIQEVDTRERDAISRLLTEPVVSALATGVSEPSVRLTGTGGMIEAVGGLSVRNSCAIRDILAMRVSGASGLEGTADKYFRQMHDAVGRKCSDEAGREPTTGGADDSEPKVTPHTVEPDLLNGAEVQEAMMREYPKELRDAGIGGVAVAWIYVDDTGAARRTRIQRSSGHPALDEAALKVAAIARFAPAQDGDTPVSTWIAVPISFRTR